MTGSKESSRQAIGTAAKTGGNQFFMAAGCFLLFVMTSCHSSGISGSDFLTACGTGDIRSVETYIAEGGNIGIKDGQGSPLEIACENRQLGIVDCLISNHADFLDTKYSLYRYAQDGELFALLLKKGVPCNRADSGGLYPIHYQAKYMNLNNMKELIRRGCDINTLSGSGLSPLMIFLTADINADDLSLFISLGADIHLTSSSGETPAHVAAMKGNVQAMKILVSCGADLNVKDKNGMTPYHYAVLFGNREMVTYLQKIKAPSKP